MHMYRHILQCSPYARAQATLRHKEEGRGKRLPYGFKRPYSWSWAYPAMLRNYSNNGPLTAHSWRHSRAHMRLATTAVPWLTSPLTSHTGASGSSSARSWSENHQIKVGQA